MRKDYSEKILVAIVEILVGARKKQGFSQQTLAEKAGLTRPAISFMESGRNKPSLGVCIKLANALGISFEQLAKMAEKKVK